MNTNAGITNSIYEFLDIKDLETLSYVNKEFNSDINLKHGDKIFQSKMINIPIIQSNLHWMCSNNSNPIRYKWNKTDFTPEQKAKINIYMLDNLSSYEFPRYGAGSLIFSLHPKGLMCQLPSTSHVIREHPKSSGIIECSFLRIFALSSEASSGYSDELTEEWDIAPKYSKIKIVNNRDDINLDDFLELSKVVKLMEEFYIEREGKIMVRNEITFNHNNYIDYANYVNIIDDVTNTNANSNN